MGTRGGQNNEVINVGDDTTKGKAGADTSGTLQGSSPYQSPDGLKQVRDIATTPNTAGNLQEVQWAQTSDGKGDRVGDKPPTDDTGNKLAEMITSTRTGPGQNLDQLRASNPALAGEVDKLAQALSQKSPEEVANVLNVMRDLYKGFDGNPGDNRESVAALRAGKLDPKDVQPVFKKAEELLQLTPEKRAKELVKIKDQLRRFYLD